VTGAVLDELESRACSKDCAKARTSTRARRAELLAQIRDAQERREEARRA
jgi:hypothetical protein